MSGLIAAGDLRLAVLEDGVSTGYGEVINALKLSIAKEGGETKQRLSRQRDNYNSVLDAIGIPGYDVLNIETDEAGDVVISDMLMGAISILNTAGDTVDVGTPEDLVAIIGKWIPIGHRDLVNTVFKDVTDTTTLVLGTDYELDAIGGLVKFLDDGPATVADDDVIHYSGDYGAVVGTRVTASQRSEFRVAVIFDGVNLATQKKFHMEITDVPLTQGGEIDLASSDFVVSSWTGTIAGTTTIDTID